MPGIINPYYGIELEYKIKKSGIKIEDWFMSTDRELTKQEELHKTICSISQVVTGLEAELLATNIYERIYNNSTTDPSSFDSCLQYDDMYLDIDLNKPYLEKYTRFELNRYFKNFDEFISLSRPSISEFLETISEVLDKEAKVKKSGEKEALRDAMGSLKDLM